MFENQNSLELKTYQTDSTSTHSLCCFYIIKEQISPDFSERGNNLARNSWILPQNTVFCDLDNLRKRSEKQQKTLVTIWLCLESKNLHAQIPCAPLLIQRGESPWRSLQTVSLTIPCPVQFHRVPNMIPSRVDFQNIVKPAIRKRMWGGSVGPAGCQLLLEMKRW